MTSETELGQASANDAELAELRSRNAALREELQASRQVESKGRRGRRGLSVIAAVIAAILIPLAVLTLWARNTMLDTNQYVDTVGPLIEDEDIQEAVSFRVSEAVANAADFQAIAEEVLPPNATVLAGPIDAGARTVIAQAVDALVGTDEFRTAWEESNRIAHSNVVLLLKGEGGDRVETSDGRVVVKLGALTELALERLEGRLGSDVVSRIPVEAIDAEIVLIDSPELAKAQRQVRWFNALGWLLVILALGFLAVVVLVAEDRRQGFRRLGLAVTIPTVITLIAVSWARGRYLDLLGDDVHNPDAAAAVYDTLTQFPLRAIRVLLILGVLTLVGVWLRGTSSGAAKARDAWNTLLGQQAASSQGGGPIVGFVGEHERALLMGTVSLGALVLIAWQHPTGWVVLIIAALTAVVAGGVRLLAEIDHKSSNTAVDIRSVDVD